MSQAPYPPSSDIPDTSSASLRLVCCNLQYGTPAEGWKKNAKLNMKRMAPSSYQARNTLIKAAQELKSLNPDILLVQEVDMYQLRSGNADQVDYIATILGMDYWAYAPIFSGHVVGIHHNPRSVFARGKRGYGLALFSRFPIRRSLSLSLPGRTSLISRSALPDSDNGVLQRANTYAHDIFQYCKALIKNQPRIVQSVLTETPLGTLAIGNTHLETQSEVAKRQARLAWQSLCSLDADAYLLAGDFNLTPQSVKESLAVLPEAKRPNFHYSAQTFPASAPRHHLDQLLVCGLHALSTPKTRRLSISDHLAIIYDLTI